MAKKEKSSKKATEQNIERDRQLFRKNHAIHKMMHKVCLVLWLSILLMGIAVFELVEALMTKGTESTLIDKMMSVANDTKDVLIIIIGVFVLVFITILIGKSNEKCELCDRMEDVYYSGLDQLIKTRQIKQILEKYDYEGQIPEREKGVLNISEKAYSLKEKLTAIKAVMKRRSAELDGMAVVELALSVVVTVMNFGFFKLEGTLLEIIIYLTVLINGIFAIVNSIEEKKKRNFIMAIIDEFDETKEANQ